MSVAEAFAGLRLLDLSRLLPGPYCSLLFADLGAEVIKVEEPGLGDYARSNLPHYGKTGVGAAYLMLNRNKKSLALNLKADAGKAIFRRLIRTADVLLESFRPGVMDRLGLGWEALRGENPGLVYCALSGYGQDGPYRNLVGHDINYMGYAGALAITGPRGGPPLMPGVQVADIGGGALMAAFAIAAALHHRARAGQGQFLDVSMTDGVVSWLANHYGPFFATGQLPVRGEERLNGGWVCYQIYETADGKHLTLGALEPKFWANLCALLRREDLIPHQYATARRATGWRRSSGRSSGPSPGTSGSGSSTRWTSAPAPSSPSRRRSRTPSSSTAASSRRWRIPPTGRSPRWRSR